MCISVSRGGVDSFAPVGAEQEEALRHLFRALAPHADRLRREWYLRFAAERGAPAAPDSFVCAFELVLEALVGPFVEGHCSETIDVLREVARRVQSSAPVIEVMAALHALADATEALARELGLPVPLGGLARLAHCCTAIVVRATGARTSGSPRKLTDPARSLVGSSVAMQRLYDGIRAAALGHGSTLIVGESGTGKELVGRAIHQCSSRALRPFVVVNCAALPRELIEAELFGHVRGAFTGAQHEARGLVRAASGGTLVLDEITEMPLETQAKLLRVIEERKVRPVGSTVEMPVDVRFLASTNRCPQGATSNGHLRRDLFYRIDVHQVAVPPLRERLEDVEELALHFAGFLADGGLRAIDRVNEDALAALRAYDWPGNVRELRNVVEVALIAGSGPILALDHLPPRVRGGVPAVRGGVPAVRGGVPAVRAQAEPSCEVPTLAEAERAAIEHALRATRGNKLRAARLLQISRHRLYDKLRKYRLG